VEEERRRSESAATSREKRQRMKRKTYHHQNPRLPPRPLPLKSLVHTPHPLPHLRLISVDLFNRRPVLLRLRHLRVPVPDLVRVVDVRVDAALEDFGEMRGLGVRFVE
jgi:hypothetical protein